MKTRGILINAAVFAAGAVIGSAVTWKVVEKKYEKIAQEEIDSVKEVYSKKKYAGISLADIPAEEPIESIEEETKAIKQECNTIIENMGYKSYSDITKKKEEEEPMDKEKPYVISPDEYDELGYKTHSLIWFNDKVLTDDNYEMVDNMSETVGTDFMNHFGEYEDDSVFIRNDAKQCDYEILMDSRNYTDVEGN